MLTYNLSTPNQTTNQEVSEKHAWYQSTKTAVCIAGFFADLAFSIFLINHRIGSRMSTNLLRLQSVEDMIIMFLSVIIDLQPIGMPSTGNAFLNELVCRLWYSQALYWMCVGVSVWNLVWVSMDRFLLIFYPIRYRRMPPFVLPILLILELTISGLPHILSCFFMARYRDSQCNAFKEVWPHSAFMQKVQTAYSILWEVLYWIIPSLLIIFFNIAIIKALRVKAIDSTERQRRALTMRYTIAAVIISFAFSACFSLDGYLFISTLSQGGKRTYYNSPLQKLGMFLVSFNFVLNPFVFLLLLRDFRGFVFCQKK